MIGDVLAPEQRAVIRAHQDVVSFDRFPQRHRVGQLRLPRHRREINQLGANRPNEWSSAEHLHPIALALRAVDQFRGIDRVADAGRAAHRRFRRREPWLGRQRCVIQCGHEIARCPRERAASGEPRAHFRLENRDAIRLLPELRPTHVARRIGILGELHQRLCLLRRQAIQRRLLGEERACRLADRLRRFRREKLRGTFRTDHLRGIAGAVHLHMKGRYARGERSSRVVHRTRRTSRRRRPVGGIHRLIADIEIRIRLFRLAWELRGRGGDEKAGESEGESKGASCHRRGFVISHMRIAAKVELNSTPRPHARGARIALAQYARATRADDRLPYFLIASPVIGTKRTGNTARRSSWPFFFSRR